MSLFDLTGKTAFVTGASRGIGRVIAVALADAGADVALVARSADGLAETAEAIDAVGRKAVVIPTDVTSYDAVADAVAAAIDQLGAVDIVVNNAGGSNFMVPFRDLRLSGWDKLIQLNLSSAVYVCHAFAGHLLDRGTGSVINVASVAGIAASPLITPYGAAKAGLVSLTKSLAVEWGTARRPGERAVPRLDRDRAEPHALGGPGHRPGHGRDVGDEAVGQPGGDGGPGGVPGQRRIVVHDRPDAGRRRRPDDQRLSAGSRQARGCRRPAAPDTRRQPVGRR